MSTKVKTWAWILLLATMSGCNLPGIGFYGTTDPEPNPEPQVCEPSSRRCTSGNTLQVCAVDGSDFDVRVCLNSETCTDGTCQAIENTCATGQPFSFSATRMEFEVRADYKSQVATLLVENCSDREIVIEQAIVRSPDRPDGDPVFILTSEFGQRIKVAPQSKIPIGITYRPSPGLSRVVGSLDLGITSNSYGRYSIPLTTRAVCTSSTPMLRLGVVQDPVSEAIYFQNCGTEPIEITEISSGSTSAKPLRKLPYTVDPLQHLEVEVVPPSEVGIVDDLIVFKSGDATVATTQVQGFVAKAECAALSLGPFAPTSPIGVRSTVAIVPDSVEVGTLPFFETITRPASSRAHAISRGEVATLKPDVVGSYVVQARAVDGSAVSCGAVEASYEALPDLPYLVEVTWENVGDLIPEDAGPGRGVNLDLHVVVRDGESGWLGPADCHVDRQSCAETRGVMASSSFAGERPEAVVINDALADFDVGVHLANPFGFPGAEARVRVFANGELVEETTRLLVTANEFWWVGRWESGTQIWTEVDSVFDGVPR